MNEYEIKFTIAEFKLIDNLIIELQHRQGGEGEDGPLLRSIRAKLERKNNELAIPPK